MIIFLIAFLVFIINIPFGFWRKSQKKFSLNWFIAIHAPVVVSIYLRYLAEIDFKWSYLIIFVFVFFTGQTAGKFLYTFKYKFVMAKKTNDQYPNRFNVNK